MQRKKILIAKGNNGVPSESIEKMFSERGHSVACIDPPDLMSREIHRDQYHLVIAEWELPGLGDFDQIQKVKEADHSMPVIVIAGDAEVKDAVEAMKHGADEFLLKPVTQEVVDIVQSYMSNGINRSTRANQNGKFRIITQNSQMKRLMELAQDIADSQASVLIQGESGTGKELFARYIYHNSARSQHSYIAVNCAALPETLLESELFGHEKGAFTGAVGKKKGKFELADRGTLLLDEISEMDYPLQSKLLRVLQEKEIDRIGGAHPVPVDVRVIATTNRELEKEVRDGNFREDLYYRLNVIPIHLPPLRERRDDIPTLTEHFIRKYNRIDNKNVKGLTDDAMTTLLQMPWKGNVRELENVIERAVLLCKREVIDETTLFASDSGFSIPKEMPPLIQSGSLKEVEKHMIFQTLDQTNGNRTHAAEILGISVRTLRNKLNEYKKTMEAF